VTGQIRKNRRRVDVASIIIGIALLVLVYPIPGMAVETGEIAASYDVTWAGLPAGEVRLSLHQSGNDYRDRIVIASKGLSRWITKFSADGVAEGSLPIKGPPMPLRYDAHYDLHKRRDNRINLHHADHGDGLIAERGAEDTSHKPPLAALFRHNVLDPLSALAFLRHELQVNRPANRQFMVPVFDGARRFDVTVNVLSSGAADHLIRLRLTLRPIAGFKGETSEDGDPDSAPRPVDLVLTDDGALLPVSLRVSIAYLPLQVRFDQRCDSLETCANGAQ
jgi:hypothetical protein